MKKALNPFAQSIGIPEIDLKMKLSLFILLITMFSLKANTAYSQKTKISLHMENVTVSQVIDEIEVKTEFKFIFNTKALDLKRIVSLNVKKLTVDRVLEKLFSKTETTFEIDNRKILLRQKHVNKGSPIDEAEIAVPQDLEVSGTITDENGAPLPGASVVEKETTNGTQTNFDGEFSIVLKSSNPTLVISYIGYATQEIIVADLIEFNIQLVPDAAKLDEVVLVGYGSVSKKDLTGAVTTVKDVGARPVTTTEEALQGRIAGVSIVSEGGDPNGTPSIKIRGIGTFNDESPLFVVDGVPYFGGPINPFDIESITVLKDASSQAIYGVRASGGVILVTTKKGKNGKVTFDFNSFTGFQNVDKPTPLSAAEGARYKDIAFNNDDPTFPIQTQEFYEENFETRTNWIDEIFRTGITQNYDIGARGGNEKYRFSTSIGHNNKQGTLINTKATRTTFRLNSEFQASDKLKIGQNIAYSRINGNSAFTGTTDENGIQSYRGIILQTILADPGVDVRNPDGSYTDLPSTASLHPVSALERIDIENITDDLFGNLYLEYKPLNGLNIKSSFGINSKRNDFKEFIPKSPERSNDTRNQNSLDVATSKQVDWSLETTINYNKIFNEKHNLTLLAGNTLQRFQIDNFSITGRDFSTEADTARELVNAATFTPPFTSYSANSLQSYFGRAIYGYDDKYLLTASLRTDGTSKIPSSVSDNTWGTFPAVALAWRASEEGFLNESKSISNLKLRGSWGIIGNINSLGDFATNPQLSVVPTVLGEAADTATGIAAATRADLGIQWEKTESLNFGLDLGLLDNRLTFTADYFVKDTEDLIFQLPVSSLEGINDSPFVNAGVVRNKGIETSLTYAKNDGDFTYSISGNLSSIDNEVLELTDDIEIFHANNVATLTPLKTVVGQPIYSFFVVETDGLDDNGDLVFVDQNGDGVINDADNVFKGSAFADITYSLTGSFEYKGFDLNVFFQGVGGSQAFNGFKHASVYNIGLGNPTVNLSTQARDTWHPGNTGSTNFRLSHKDDNGNLTTASDFWLEDTSYLRLKNITLGYTLSNMSFFNRLRFYVAAENLFTITGYEGLDPEVGLNNNGLDGGQYPVSRTLTFGLNLGF